MRTRAVYFTATTHYLQEDYYIIIILYGFGQCFPILQEKTVWKRSKLSTKECYEQISWLAAHVKLYLVLSAFREHRGGADPQRGKPARAHTYASQALPVDVDRNPGETSLSSATVLLPSPKSIFKNVKCCHSTNGEAEVLKDAKMCLRLPRLMVRGAPWSPRTPPWLPGLWPIDQSQVLEGWIHPLLCRLGGHTAGTPLGHGWRTALLTARLSPSPAATKSALEMQL